MSRIARNARAIVGLDSFRPLELGLGLLGVVWGGWLLNPYAATFATSPAFTDMSHLAPEEVWGGFIFVVGAVTVLAVLLDDNLPPTSGKGPDIPLLLRAASSLCASGFWASVASFLAAYNPASTGTPIYGWVSAGALVTATRIFMLLIRRSQGARAQPDTGGGA